MNDYRISPSAEIDLVVSEGGERVSTNFLGGTTCDAF
jgi:hypothetical protein